MDETNRPLYFFFKGFDVDDEQHIVSGYASTDSFDDQGEQIDPNGLKEAFDEFMEWANLREMHGKTAAGKVLRGEFEDGGRKLRIWAKISDPTTWQKIKDKVLQGFSIGGQVVARIGKTITQLRLNEISVVDRPANPECVIDVVKRSPLADDNTITISAGGADGFLLTISRPKRSEPIAKQSNAPATRDSGRAKCATCGGDDGNHLASCFVPNHQPNPTENTSMTLKDILAKFSTALDELKASKEVGEAHKPIVAELETLCKGLGMSEEDIKVAREKADADAKAKNVTADLGAIAKALGITEEKFREAITKAAEGNGNTQTDISTANAGEGLRHSFKEASSDMDMACKAMDEADGEEDEGKRKKAMKKGFGLFKSALGKASAAFSKASETVTKAGGLVDLTPYAKASDMDDLADRFTALAQYIGELPARPRPEAVEKFSASKEDDSKPSAYLKRVLENARS